MDEPWDPAALGVVRLPSGRLVRGRALRRPVPAGPEPQWALHLLGRTPPAVPWPSRWLRWPDLRLPADGIVCADASYSSNWVINYLTAKRAGQRFLTPRGLAGLGWGVPLAAVEPM